MIKMYNENAAVHLMQCVFVMCGSKVPSYLNIVDIAGLVKGAHEGQGLGNAFLSHIRACDAVFHMTRQSLVTQFHIITNLGTVSSNK